MRERRARRGRDGAAGVGGWEMRRKPDQEKRRKGWKSEMQERSSAALNHLNTTALGPVTGKLPHPGSISSGGGAVSWKNEGNDGGHTRSKWIHFGFQLAESESWIKIQPFCDQHNSNVHRLSVLIGLHSHSPTCVGANGPPEVGNRFWDDLVCGAEAAPLIYS